MSENETNEDVAVADVDGADGEFEFAEDPTFDVDYKGDCAYEVKVAIPASNTLKQSEEMYGELQGDAEIPGFRRGKAPRKLLERKFGKAVRGEATEKLVSAAFRKLIKAEDLTPIDYPDIEGLEDVHDTPLDSALEFTLKFEVAPRVELGSYTGIKVERPVLKVEDKEVDEAVENMRERFASYEVVEGAKAKAKDDDQVVIDFTGVIDGVAFDGGSAENYPYILGSGRFFSEFETALKGAKTGSEVVCDVPFPDDYSSVDLAGKTATFTIKVNEIKRKTLPELNDDFATGGGFESMADLREKVSKDLQEGANSQGQQIAERRAVEAIVAASTFELPKSLVESSAKEYYNQELRRLLELRVSPEEIDKRNEELLKQADEHANREIKAYVVVNEIGAKEGVQVLDEDFEKEAQAIVNRTGMDVDIAKRFLSQDDKRSDYETRIFRQKALAIVMDSAKVKDKVVTREELYKEDEEDNA